MTKTTCWTIWVSNPGSDKSSFSRPITPRPTLGTTHAPAQRVQLAVSVGFKGQEREIGLSLLSIVEVKNELSFTSTPLCGVMAWTGATLLYLLLYYYRNVWNGLSVL
jgi:hypothetical protein